MTGQIAQQPSIRDWLRHEAPARRGITRGPLDGRGAFSPGD